MADVTLGLVGATGVVGKQVLSALERRDYESEGLRCFASEKSEGEELEYAGETLAIEKCSPDMFRGLDAVILACPQETARDLAGHAQAAGCWVVDLSGAFRTDEKVPMVAPGVNDGVLDRPFTGHIVSMASPPAQALLAVLEPLKQKFGLLTADVTVLQGAASKGLAGIERLAKQTTDLLSGREPDVDVFPHRLGFNIVPGAGDFEGGLSAVERAMLVEVVRVWSGAGRLPVLSATAMYVPTYHGTVLTIAAHLERPVDADGVRAVLRAESQLKILDDVATQVYPMPMLVTDDETVHVGRVRALAERVQLVAAVDNAYRAADAAIDVALELADRD